MKRRRGGATHLGSTNTCNNDQIVEPAAHLINPSDQPIRSAHQIGLGDRVDGYGACRLPGSNLADSRRPTTARAARGWKALL
jgi:hypothetical protein